MRGRKCGKDKFFYFTHLTDLIFQELMKQISDQNRLSTLEPKDVIYVSILFESSVDHIECKKPTDNVT